MKLLTPATADDSFWCVVNTYDKTRDSLTPEKLHGIIKPLLLTDTLLDYISFLLIQKKKKNFLNSLRVLTLFSRYNLWKTYPTSLIPNSAQHLLMHIAVAGVASPSKLALLNSKTIKHSYFSCGTGKQVIYHLIETINNWSHQPTTKGL